MLKIRLQRKGSKKKPFFLIVLINSNKSRDGKFIEKLGYFNPIKKDFIKINLTKINYWISKGAQLTNKVKYIKKLFLNFINT